MSANTALDPLRFENGPGIVCATLQRRSVWHRDAGRCGNRIPSPAGVVASKSQSTTMSSSPLVAASAGGLDPTLRRRLWQAVTDATGRPFGLHDR
jgi:hypothetical protein